MKSNGSRNLPLSPGNIGSTTTDSFFENSERLLTVRELSDLLSIPTSTLYRWAELGKIPSVKLGSLRRFGLKAIERWVSQQNKEIHHVG